ncbi:MAG: hypothetical protein LUF04_11435 [Bacteroides sp.]|nr:hypothetical protein [Bacteroides sp.]
MSVISRSNYDKLVSRRQIVVARPGKGPGNYALIVLDSIPDRIRGKIIHLYPQSGRMKLEEWIRRNFTLDHRARNEYTMFRFEDGSPLPSDKIKEYTINASVIQTVCRLMENTKTLRRAVPGRRVHWEELAEVIAFLKKEYGHTLPESTLRFRRKISDFSRYGYSSLISRKFRNQNSRKVNSQIERLILSLDSLPQQPFNSTVFSLYNAFMRGELEVYDPQTGELYLPEQFKNAAGEFSFLSEATVANYLNTPCNKILRAKLHSSSYEFNHQYRPHHHRISPDFAFSKISLDDRDLPRKMKDGRRVKAYYAYDVASGCVIGYAYSVYKNRELFLDCLRNMFRLIDRQNWNCPAEIEVEHHLVRELSDGLLKAGTVFPFVRWCNPTNSQEKRAEHFNRIKKYCVEKREQVGIGRWYARLEVNRPRVEKVFDAHNDTYKEAIYSYEQLVEEDIKAIESYNNQLHSNQKKYPGLTRWQILCQKQNPLLTPVDKAVLYSFIGEKRKTTIRRHMYCMVNGIRYVLPSASVIERLGPRDYQVEACFLPDEKGNISEIYLYQKGKFIALCQPMKLYNESEIEKNMSDRIAYREQAEYVAGFDRLVECKQIQKIAILPGEDTWETETVVCAPTTSETPEPEFLSSMENYSKMALEDL